MEQDIPLKQYSPLITIDLSFSNERDYFFAMFYRFDERQTRNAKRETTNAKRQTRNAKRQTVNSKP